MGAATRRERGATSALKASRLSDVESVGSVVEKGDVEGEDGGGVTGDALGNVGGRPETVGVEAQEGGGRRRREGGRIADVEKGPRVDLTRVLEVGNGGEAEGVDIC